MVTDNWTDNYVVLGGVETLVQNSVRSVINFKKIMHQSCQLCKGYTAIKHRMASPKLQQSKALLTISADAQGRCLTRWVRLNICWNPFGRTIAKNRHPGKYINFYKESTYEKSIFKMLRNYRSFTCIHGLLV